MFNRRIVYWAVTSALAGFLFGFDTVVISGAEQTIQSLWGLSAGVHGIAMASALYGTVVGSLIGGWPADRFGRKTTLLWDRRALHHLRARVRASRTASSMFIAARIIGGIGIGVSTVVAPLYISEIAPPAHRGRLAGMFQFNIVFGIVIAFVSNALLAGIGENAWRWMLGVAAFPSVLYTLMCFGIPESPRWLLARKGDRAAGVRVLGLIEPDATPAELEAMPTRSSPPPPSSEHRGFWSMRLRVPILLAFLVAFFNQLSGINAILYFAPRIFEMTGLGAKAALLQSVGIGITNSSSLSSALWLIDRLGRRTLLTIGSFGYIAVARTCCVGVLHRALRDRAALHLRLHRRARHRAGDGDLGVHLGDLPQPVPCRRPDARQRDALGVRRAPDDVVPRDGRRLRARLHLPRSSAA